MLYFVPLWVLGIRPFPKLEGNDYKKIFVVSMLHSVGHIATVIAMSAGAVSFTHIVKVRSAAVVVVVRRPLRSVARCGAV